MHGLEEVQIFGDENEIRPQSNNLLETRIDSAAHFGFFLSIRRIIAIIRVSDEAILQTKRIDGLCKTWRQRNNALHGLGDANGAACFIHEILIKRCGGRALRWRLSLRWGTPARGAEQQRGNSASRRYILLCVFPYRHNSPPAKPNPLHNKKAPRDTLGLAATLLLAKSASLCGAGG